MRKIVVSGGRTLSGEVEIGGSKNAALPILFGGIVTGGECLFSHLPRVSDVLRALEILRYLGARISFLENGNVRVDYRSMQEGLPPTAMTSTIRGSTYLLGAMLARFGKARLGGAGGCDFGSRPIDQHLLGFAKLGAQIDEMDGMVTLTADNGLCGTHIRLAMPSVGATANLLLAATSADGVTVIENAAAEPHVAALAAFLTDAGASIGGIGTSVLTVTGKKPLNGVKNTIIPDMIEAGTYLALGAACRGPVCVRSVCPEHLTALLDHFQAMGVTVEAEEQAITVSAPQKYRNTDIVTGPFPAFPTDLHPQMAALFCIGDRAVGKGSVEERVFESRFRYTEGLAAMGADVKIEGNRAVFSPVCLHSAKLRSPDLRGGAALLIAALATVGESEITNAFTVARGYEHLEEKLTGLGAAVRVC